MLAASRSWGFESLPGHHLAFLSERSELRKASVRRSPQGVDGLEQDSEIIPGSVPNFHRIVKLLIYSNSIGSSLLRCLRSLPSTL